MNNQQPINEAYKNEILEAYQKISETFNDFTLLMRKRVPYDEWPSHCKMAGVSEELMGKPDVEESFKEDISKCCEKVLDDLDKAIVHGIPYLQSHCRLDVTFRAMVDIMKAWKAYIDRKDKKVNRFSLLKQKVLSIIKDIDPTADQVIYDNIWDLYVMVTKKESECEE